MRRAFFNVTTTARYRKAAAEEEGGMGLGGLKIFVFDLVILSFGTDTYQSLTSFALATCRQQTIVVHITSEKKTSPTVLGDKIMKK